MKTEFDIVIVGAGIVGLSLACELANTELSVLLLERYELTPPSGTTQCRVSAINPFALNRFEQLKVWQHPLTERACRYQKMFVWAQKGVGQISFDSAKIQQHKSNIQDLGVIIENNVLQQILLDKIKQADNVQLKCPVEVSHIDYSPELKNQQTNSCVHLTSGENINAKLLIGADGINSKVRETAHISRQQISYQQQALVCNIQTQESHQNTAWQCFMPTGPLALLPLYNGESSIVWSLDEHVAEQHLALDDEPFKQALASASEYKLGNIKSIGKRYLFPLTHGHSAHYVSEGLALIGDAAHNIHPLAGQGANLGIGDAAALAAVILKAKQAKRQWYSKTTLSKYQRQRKAKNQLMEHTMSGFKTLFAGDNAVLDELRNVGLTLVDNLPALKYRLIQQALGM